MTVDLATDREVARTLGVSRQVIRELAEEGRIPSVVIPVRVRRYDLRAVLGHVDRCRRQSETE